MDEQSQQSEWSLTITMLPPLGAGQVMSDPLIVTETHSGGIALHKDNASICLRCAV